VRRLRSIRGYVTKRAALLPVALLLVAVAAAISSPARPAAAASSTGGVIYRSEVIQRAQYWVNQGYTYNTNASKPDPQGKSYRTDCSGLVSMAWHLSANYNTAQFDDTSGSHPWRAVAGGLDGLLPGDAMVRNDGTAGHMELFVAWVDPNHHGSGAYVYSFNQTGWSVENPYKLNNKGYPGKDAWSEMTTYKAITYTNIRTDSWPTASVWCRYIVTGGAASNERSGPGLAHPVMTQVAANASVFVGTGAGVSADGHTWLRVDDGWGADAHGGFIASEFISKTNDPCFS
jgi:hypothetical protein